MAKQAKDTEDKSLTRADIRQALTDDVENNKSISMPLIMSSDNMPEAQNAQTVRFALNAVLEDRYENNRLQNEESNELCIQLEKREYAEYRLKISGCCRNVLYVFYSDVDSLRAALYGGFNAASNCNATSPAMWKINGTDIEGQNSVIYDYISSNMGNYTISSLSCEETPINTIKIYPCCGGDPVEFQFEGEYLLEPELLRNIHLNTCDDLGYYLGKEDNTSVWGILRREGAIDYEIVSGPSVIITTNAEIEILCTDKRCDKFNSPNVFVSNVSINEVSIGGTPVDYIEYDDVTLSLDGFPFRIEMGISITVNGIVLAYGTQWVLNTDGTITISYPLDSYSKLTVFMKDYCNGYFERTLMLSTNEVDLRSGQNIIGSITVSEGVMVSPSSTLINIEGKSSTGLIGRALNNGGRITGYKVKNQNNVVSEIHTDNFFFNLIYNKEIELIIADKK